MKEMKFKVSIINYNNVENAIISLIKKTNNCMYVRRYDFSTYVSVHVTLYKKDIKEILPELNLTLYP
jgi:hypothetical protein